MVFKRSPIALSDEVELLAFLDRMDYLLPPSVRKTLGLLMDMRDGPLRNEPEYEARMHRSVNRMVAGFHRVAILMQTSMGLLQASRLRREHGLLLREPRPFLSEADARAYLTDSDSTS